MTGPLRFDVLTLFPSMVAGPLNESVIGRAIGRGDVALGVHDIRDATTDRHRTVDDTPYGGGAGMVLKVDVVADALDKVRRPESLVLLTSPSGRPFTQATARRLARESHLVFICGHYEGIDARIETLVDEQLSLGDFVMTSGEIAAVAFIDAIARLVPGVLGNEGSLDDESFGAGLLEHPHYTRPREWLDHSVPDVLLSGHHGKILAWRHAQAQARTAAMRPDLWQAWLERQGRVDEPPADD